MTVKRRGHTPTQGVRKLRHAACRLGTTTSRPPAAGDPATKSHLDRLDPSGELAEAERLAESLSDPAVRGALRLMGVRAEALDDAGGRAGVVLAQLRRMTAGVRQAALHLPQLGWIPFSSMPDELYRHAADLAARGQPHEAERVLVEGWNRDEQIRWQLQRVKSLGIAEGEYREHFMRRWELLERARKHHEAGAYEASVLILLTQMDGVVIDVTGERKQDFFSGGDYLVDETTLAGHPEGLRAIARLMSRDVRETGSTGQLARHSILHGRELGYDTLVNSTKAFAALFAVIEWAQPLMRATAERLQREREDRFAGSKDLDEDGRRLDRRGFDAAKISLLRQRQVSGRRKI